MIEPAIEQRIIEFNVILQPIGAVAIAERLVSGIAVGGQQNRAGRKIKGIFVPVKDLLLTWEPGIEWIALTFFGKMHIVEAELSQSVTFHGATQRFGQ